MSFLGKRRHNTDFTTDICGSKADFVMKYPSGKIGIRLVNYWKTVLVDGSAISNLVK
ncbi:hypothetical protein H710_00192 [Bartonella bacilliformis Ver097]|uniref:Uncharacterized protein n=1 Tax=Bartonella bacilliformis Ver097 TaxID=1293911 RepID=A0A072RIC3_BARBA|nr:hypothetical protein H710_00192 [Bartonella bacilliformis Ver097]